MIGRWKRIYKKLELNHWVKIEWNYVKTNRCDWMRVKFVRGLNKSFSVQRLNSNLVFTAQFNDVTPSIFNFKGCLLFDFRIVSYDWPLTSSLLDRQLWSRRCPKLRLSTFEFQDRLFSRTVHNRLTLLFKLPRTVHFRLNPKISISSN